MSNAIVVLQGATVALRACRLCEEKATTETRVPMRTRSPKWILSLVTIAAGGSAGFLLAKSKSLASSHREDPQHVTAPRANDSDSVGFGPGKRAAALPFGRSLQEPSAAVKLPAADVVNAIYHQIDATFHPGDSAEGAVVRSTEFITGWVEAVRFSSSGLLGEVAQIFRASLCDPNTSSHRLFLIGRLLQMMPEAGSPEGFDCIFQRRPVVEDVAFWSLLDAWKISGSEPSHALAELRGLVSDARTLRRLNRETRQHPSNRFSKGHSTRADY